MTALEVMYSCQSEGRADVRYLLSIGWHVRCDVCVVVVVVVWCGVVRCGGVVMRGAGLSWRWCSIECVLPATTTRYSATHQYCLPPSADRRSACLLACLLLSSLFHVECAPTSESRPGCCYRFSSAGRSQFECAVWRVWHQHGSTSHQPPSYEVRHSTTSCDQLHAVTSRSSVTC